MTLNDFITKHSDLINRGVITITTENPKINDFLKSIESDLTSDEKQEYVRLIKTTKLFGSGDTYITIDRFVDGDFIAEKHELIAPRRDVIKMGFDKSFGVGVYKNSK
jgi:hypothetical protein